MMKLLNKTLTLEKLKRDQALAIRNIRDSQVNKLVANLKAATPVDTGHARDSWSSNSSVEKNEIVNTAQYIEYLNQGSSPQAPAHFIESEALKVGKPSGVIVEVR